VSDRRVGTDDEKAVGVFQLIEGVGHGAASECEGKTCHGGAVSEAGAMIHVVGADGSACKLLQDVVLFVGAASGTEKGDAVRSVCIPDPSKLTRRISQSLIPWDLPGDPVFADERLLEPIRMLHELMDVPALDAELSSVGGTGFRRHRRHDPSVQYLEPHPTATSTDWTRSDHRLEFHSQITSLLHVKPEPE